MTAKGLVIYNDDTWFLMNKDEKKAYRRVINDTATKMLMDVQKKSWDIYDDIYKELLIALYQKIGAILENQNTEPK